ncbi:MAG: hypothetical protein AB8H12_14315 [Lewinella sp.]
MFRFILFLFLIGSLSTLQAQKTSARLGSTTGLCGNYDADFCSLLNDEIFPGGTIELEIYSCMPDVATISLRRLEDGQPLVEVARRLHSGQQVLSISLPDFAEPGFYRMEVRSGSGNFADVLEQL